jgi:YgiT-type zinc finger domain-containing protein
MKCVICKHGELKSEITSLMYKNNSTIVIKEVPVDMCDNCGEIIFLKRLRSRLCFLLYLWKVRG